MIKEWRYKCSNVFRYEADRFQVFRATSRPIMSQCNSTASEKKGDTMLEVSSGVCRQSEDRSWSASTTAGRVKYNCGCVDALSSPLMFILKVILRL